MGRYTAYGVAYSSLILGFGSLLAFVVFLFTGSFSVFDQGWNPRAALYLDACLCLLFFIQHSVLIRRSVRTRLTRWIPDEYYGAFYSMTSGIALTFVLLWWQKTPVLAASAGGMFRWVLHGLFFLCIAGFSWGTGDLRPVRRTEDPAPCASAGPGTGVPHGAGGLSLDAPPAVPLHAGHDLVLPGPDSGQAAVRRPVDCLDLRCDQARRARSRARFRGSLPGVPGTGAHARPLQDPLREGKGFIRLRNPTFPFSAESQGMPKPFPGTPYHGRIPSRGRAMQGRAVCAPWLDQMNVEEGKSG